MIEMYKFVTGKNVPNCNLKLNFHSTLASAYDTRGNIYKLILIHCKYEFKNITNRVTPIWNSLPNSVVMADLIFSFKSCLDKFWSLYDFVCAMQLQ